MKKILSILFILCMVLVGCSSRAENTITIEGSSTVYPITLEAVQGYDEVSTDARIDVTSTGTGGGFEQFTKGQTDINDASRAITPEEKTEAEKNGVEYTELQVGTDGITVIVNEENDWVDNISQSDLKSMFELDSKVSKWSDIDPSYPDEKISFYGPTSASGTYDFFGEKILGKEGAPLRSDLNATENDNEVVSNVENDKYGIGFLGYGFYSQNIDSIKSVAINGVSPEPEDIKSGEYILSRPLLIYVNNQFLNENKELQGFVNYYIDNAQELVEKSSYIPLTDEELKHQQDNLDKAITTVL